MRLRHLALILFLGVVGTCATQAAPAPEPRSWVRGWDKPVDPQKDCKFVRNGDVLTIEVPGGLHQIGKESTLGNGPRLLRTVEGDFLFQVRVGGSCNLPVVESRTPPGVSSGLVLFLDEEKCLQVLRISLRHPRTGELVTLVGTHLPSDNRRRRTTLSSENETYFRLERTGGLVRISTSDDGKSWVEVRSEKLELPARLKIGVFAASTSKEPFKARFDKFRLNLRGPKGR